MLRKWGLIGRVDRWADSKKGAYRAEKHGRMTSPLEARTRYDPFIDRAEN